MHREWGLRRSGAGVGKPLASLPQPEDVFLGKNGFIFEQKWGQITRAGTGIGAPYPEISLSRHLETKLRAYTVHQMLCLCH